MARITVVENVYHQLPAEEPYHVPSIYEQETTGDEQPYQRTYAGTCTPTPLELGWLEEAQCGLVHIENKGKVAVEVYFQDDPGRLYLPPGTSMRITPSLIILLRFRTLEEPQARNPVVVTIFPK